MIYEEDVPLTGHIKYVNDQTGYGFIAPDNGGRDVYVPRDLCRGFLKGHRVRYSSKLGVKGPVAVRVINDRDRTA